MPVALAMLATDRSISAHRITKVSPTAMMPVTEICVRMFSRLPSVANDLLAAVKKANEHEQRRERGDVAELPRSRSSASRCTASDAAHAASSSRSLLTGSSANSRTTLSFLHHQNAIGQRQHRFRFGRDDHDGDALVAQAAHDLHHVVLRADVHPARRLAQHQHARQIGQPLGQRHLLLVAAGQSAKRRVRQSAGRMRSRVDMPRGDARVRRLGAARGDRCDPGWRSSRS